MTGLSGDSQRGGSDRDGRLGAPDLDTLTDALERTRSDDIAEALERFGGYPQPKPETRVVELEVRAAQNGCRVCGGTGKVPAGLAWPEPGFLPCPACGWKS